MALVDMERTKAERKADSYASPSESEGPDYPWGLRIHLADEEVKKLGLEGLTIDKVLMLVGECKVCSISADQGEGGKTRHSIQLQITKMSLDLPSSAATKLYGDMGNGGSG